MQSLKPIGFSKCSKKQTSGGFSIEFYSMTVGDFYCFCHKGHILHTANREHVIYTQGNTSLCQNPFMRLSAKRQTLCYRFSHCSARLYPKVVFQLNKTPHHRTIDFLPYLPYIRRYEAWYSCSMLFLC